MGTFQLPRAFRVGTRPSDVAIYDMNQDGAKDLVVSNAGSDNVSVLLQSPAAIASCHDTQYAASAMTINTRPNATSTMRLIPPGGRRLPNFAQVTVSFAIPGASRRVSQFVTVRD